MTDHGAVGTMRHVSACRNGLLSIVATALLAGCSAEQAFAPTDGRATQGTSAMVDCGGGNFPKSPDDKNGPPNPVLVRVTSPIATSINDCGVPVPPPSDPYPPTLPGSPSTGTGGSNPEGNGPGGGSGITEAVGPLPPSADYGRPVSGTMSVVRGGTESTCNAAGICAPNSVVIKALKIAGRDNENRLSTFVLTNVTLHRVRGAGLIDNGTSMTAWYAFDRGEFNQVAVSGSTAQLWYMNRLEMTSTFQLQGSDWGGAIFQSSRRPHAFFYNAAWGGNLGSGEGVIWIPLGPHF